MLVSESYLTGFVNEDTIAILARNEMGPAGGNGAGEDHGVANQYLPEALNQVTPQRCLDPFSLAQT
jgi:hypothetical protein